MTEKNEVVFCLKEFKTTKHFLKQIAINTNWEFPIETNTDLCKNGQFMNN